MTRRKTLTDAGVKAIKSRPKTFTHPDPECRGHYVRVMPSGAKSYLAMVRNPAGKQVWTTIGRADGMLLDEARAAARSILTRVRAGLPAVEDRLTGDTFRTVMKNYIKRHIEERNLITGKEITRILQTHV